MPACRSPITCRRRSSCAAAGSLRMSTCFMPLTWSHPACLQDRPGRINNLADQTSWRVQGGRPPTASVCHGAGCRDLRRELPTMSITMIGLDVAKSVFQLHGIDASGKVQLKRKLRRSELIPFFEGQPRCTVVMEACGAAHHWARVLGGLGHGVRLIAPEAVRPFVKRGKKNDAADAAAVCAAASRPDARFVPVKSPEQQGVLALHSARALLVRQQTML